MFIYLDWLFLKFNKYRQSLGLSFFFGGLPIVYYLRDGLKLAPGSSAFTAGFTILSLLIAFPLNPKKLYQTNTIGYLMCILYAVMALLYLATYAPNRGWFTNTPVEVANQIVFLMGLFIFAGVSINDLKSTFLYFTLFFCTLGGLSLLYYIARNPAYMFGMRAAISFGDDGGMASMGNPHIYAKSAYIGIISGVILLRNEARIIWRLAIMASVLVLIVVVGLCQAMAMVLVTGIFFFLYVVTHIKLQNIYKGLKWLMGWQGLLIFFILLYFGFSLWTNQHYKGYIMVASDIIFERLERIVTSFFTDSDATAKITATVDASASTRVVNITNVFKNLDKNIENGNLFPIFFGHGYQEFYVDSPFIEMFHDLGIVGFLIFLTLHLIILKWIWKEIFNPTCDFTLMLSYFFLATLIQNFTFGMPYDYGRWCSMAFVARFALEYKKVPKYNHTILTNQIKA
ncbi:hypothetical protein Emtol_3925 [Emticicia oligotrophica DSM 17448]|uniref:O-antigen ligase domain-containing protein n=1 Tax=Emticicia oligotrophica (strain DSM 17448 / CIP 109782 / MTCC 6937 / GPTSA100-15) TaxID=929562 RepID=A0ABN4ASY2_EMTOG|nr:MULTISPECIES: hypothetical protein [Emticicia]AFK05051.1 hypothetical protein Emtol_3925 [Emticicia oligotrophica DSM 17448]